jgi:DDE family transposase
MSHSNHGSLVRQVESIQRQFAQAPGLPFAQLLPPTLLHELLHEHSIEYRDRIYTPLTTLALFLSQCHDEDQSLRQAVLRHLAQRRLDGLPACSTDTAAYCRARQRLPEQFLAALTRQTGQRLLLDAPAKWFWHGRHVKIVDGSTLSMPDTPANQQQYPQISAQQPGLGFPILRLVVVFSLAVGTVVDAAVGPYKGKQASESALFRSLHEHIDAGEVVLGDRHFCSFFRIADLQQRGADVVMRMHQLRKVNFRRGVPLGRRDHLVRWHKPQRPEWMDEETYRQYPDTLTIREVRLRLSGKNLRSRILTLATTLLDAQTYDKTDLAELYRQRWQAELNLRSLKTVLHMDVLRGKTPQMVHKEVWMHLLAYNLLRTVMAQAAQKHEVQPWLLSFKATLQTVNAFALPLLHSSKQALPELLAMMWQAIAEHRVGDRPGRLEPRALKRRAKPYDLLKKPRAIARRLEIQKSYE